MLTYSFTDRKDESLYEYLYKCIRNDIVAGILQPNEKLPSKRAFANNHGVSVITVENTYAQLMAEGYIYSRPKSGFYVSAIDSNIKIEDVKSDIINTDKNEPVSEYINLVSNHTLPESFPFSIWTKLVRKTLIENESKLLISPPVGGVMELRSAISRHLRDFRGIICEPEQIVIGAGTEYLYGLIVQLLGRDKIYGLENPSSKKIRNIYQSLGVKVSSLSMDEEGIKLTPENLTVPDVLHISPSHHFPTGYVMSVSRRYGALQWANESSNRYIIEDDYDSEFRLQGKPIPSLFSMDTTNKVIYFNTFSKSLASTIRISYMVLPVPLLELFNSKLGFYACTVSNFEQYTLADFINEHYFDKHINRMRKQYRKLRDMLIDRIKESRIGNSVQIMEENAGLHFILSISTRKNDKILKERALEQGVLVAFLSEYCSYDYNQDLSEYDHKAIINFSGLADKDIDEVVGALSVAWQDCVMNGFG